MTLFSPTTAEEVREVVAWAAAEQEPLEIVGDGTKRGIGQPMQTAHVLDMTGLTDITLYEPEELVLSAYSGTKLADITALLAQHRQQLAFEPIDYGPLLGEEVGMGTLGGLYAANLSGPRRLTAGAARDHALGVEAVSGRGEAFKSGGRVVKNVTGYDLSKGLAGSWGTLAVTTKLTFKVLPVAATEVTVMVKGLDDEKAALAMAAAIGSGAEVSAAAHLPPTVASKVADGAFGWEAATLLRLEGVKPSVEYRARLLAKLLEPAGKAEEIGTEASRALWAEIRDCRPFADGTHKPVWRVSMAPSQGWKMLDALRRHAGIDAFYDWQGGLIWLRMEAAPEAEALRALIAHFGGGHATLVRATPEQRASVPVFEPQNAALATLSSRFKSEFDPNGVLNPGRMGF